MSERSKPLRKSTVNDITRPGKTAPSASSRPIIVGHKPMVQDPMVNEAQAADSTTAAVDVKRTAPKVVAPLSDNEKRIEQNESDIESSAAVNEVSPGQVDDVVDDSAATQPATQSAQAPDGGSGSGGSSSGGPKDTDSKSSSIVSAVVDQASKNKDKKDDKKQAELEKRQAEIEKLIEDKKYYVQTSQVTKKQRKTHWVALIFVFVLLVGAYLAVDAQVVKNDIKLPLEFFKTEPQRESTVIEEDTSKEKRVLLDPAQPEQENDAGDPTQVRARDLERKNELKNLQQMLEAYFNDNGGYPASLDALSPAPTLDEITDPMGKKYVFETGGVDGAINMTFTLTAILENTDDPDADENGSYVLRSVDQ